MWLTSISGSILWKLLFWKAGVSGLKAKITWTAWTPGIYFQVSENNQLSRAPPTGTKKQRLKFKVDNIYAQYRVPFFFWKSSHNDKEYKTYFRLFLLLKDGSSRLRDPNFLTTGHWKYMHRDKSSHRRFKDWGGETLNTMLNGQQLKEMGVAQQRDRTEG